LANPKLNFSVTYNGSEGYHGRTGREGTLAIQSVLATANDLG
jgi:hypothetical protein